jgi:hypothetical protein
VIGAAVGGAVGLIAAVGIACAIRVKKNSQNKSQISASIGPSDIVIARPPEHKAKGDPSTSTSGSGNGRVRS